MNAETNTLAVAVLSSKVSTFLGKNMTPPQAENVIEALRQAGLTIVKAVETRKVDTTSSHVAAKLARATGAGRVLADSIMRGAAALPAFLPDEREALDMFIRDLGSGAIDWAAYDQAQTEDAAARAAELDEESQCAEHAAAAGETLKHIITQLALLQSDALDGQDRSECDNALQQLGADPLDWNAIEAAHAIDHNADPEDNDDKGGGADATAGGDDNAFAGETGHASEAANTADAQAEPAAAE